MFIHVIRKTTISFGGFGNASYEIRTFLNHSSKILPASFLNRKMFGQVMFYLFSKYFKILGKFQGTGVKCV